MVYRIFVEKKPGQDSEAKALAREIREFLGIEALKDLRLLNRYDAEGLDKAHFDYAVRTVFSEPQVDNASEEVSFPGAAVFAVEYLPVRPARGLRGAVHPADLPGGTAAREDREGLRPLR